MATITPDENNEVHLPERRVADPNFNEDTPPPSNVVFTFVDVRIVTLERNGTPVTFATEAERRPGWLTTFAESTFWGEYLTGEPVQWNLIAEYPPFDFELLRPPSPSDVDVYTLEYSSEVYTADDSGNFVDSVRTGSCQFTLTVQQVAP